MFDHDVRNVLSNECVWLWCMSAFGQLLAKGRQTNATCAPRRTAVVLLIGDMRPSKTEKDRQKTRPIPLRPAIALGWRQNS